jgi:uncharacterized protein
MRPELLNNDDHRTFALVLEKGEEVSDCLLEFSRAEGITAAGITGIGAFEKAELLYFDWQDKKYLKNEVDEQVEVAALVGDIAVTPEGEPSVHMHVVLGRRDGTALAGHLGNAWVRPTLELIITEQPAHLQKVEDSETGLALIRKSIAKPADGVQP